MKKIEALLLKYMPIIFGMSLIFVTVLLLAPMPPSDDVGFEHMDKLVHVLIFMALTIMGSLAYVLHKPKVYFGLFLYGGVIEVMQSMLTAKRSGDVWDWAADALGILIAMSVCILGSRFLKAKTV